MRYILREGAFESKAPSPLQKTLSPLLGTGKGSGIGLMFFLVGIIGMVLCLTRLLKPIYKALKESPPT